jgi:hypothetical protein
VLDVCTEVRATQKYGEGILGVFRAANDVAEKVKDSGASQFDFDFDFDSEDPSNAPPQPVQTAPSMPVPRVAQKITKVVLEGEGRFQGWVQGVVMWWRVAHIIHIPSLKELVFFCMTAIYLIRSKGLWRRPRLRIIKIERCEVT